MKPSACLSFALLVACSGATSTELFEPPAVTTTSSPTEPAADGGTAAAGDRADAGSGFTPYQPDAGPSDPTDAGKDWKSPGVSCSTAASGSPTYCQPGKELCCAQLDSTFGNSFSCETATQSACQDGTPLLCDDQTDCPAGQICCAVYEKGVGYRSSSCQAKCHAPAGYGNIRLCDPHAPVDECRAINATCTASTELPGFWYCE